VRLDVTPPPTPRPAAPPYLRELARVREIDLAEALGAERLEALLNQEAPAAPRSPRRRRAALLAGATLAALGLAAAFLLRP
jgi:hypothetical protein